MGYLLVHKESRSTEREDQRATSASNAATSGRLRVLLGVSFPASSMLQATGHGCRAARAGSNNAVRVLGNGHQQVAPVYLGDVVRAIQGVAMTSERAGTFDLQGPDEMIFDKLFGS
jgi:hypothetical protein